MAEEDPGPPGLEHGESPEGSAHRLLVVDDGLPVLELAQEFLERAGFEVVAAPGGEEALRAAAASPVDAVVLDVVMPGVEGEEVDEEEQEEDEEEKWRKERIEERRERGHIRVRESRSLGGEERGGGEEKKKGR